MRKCIIIRHGIAENQHADGDAARQLTFAGKLGVTRIAEQLLDHIGGGQLRDAGVRAVEVIHSPYVRTTETAKALALVFEKRIASDDTRVQVRADSVLVPQSSPKAVIDSFPEQEDHSVLFVLVTHQPLVSQLVSTLVNGDERDANDFAMYPSDAMFMMGDFFAAGLMHVDKAFSLLKLQND